MASMVHEPHGGKRVEFAWQGKRCKIRLGKVSLKQATSVRTRIEKIVAAALQNEQPDDETCRWIAALPDAMHDRLSRTGIIKPRSGHKTRLGPFIDAYIGERCDVKPATALVYGHTRRNLVDFFGTDKMLRDINGGDADQWRIVQLIGNAKLSDNTVRRRCGIAKQFFRVAVRRKLISENPFEDLKASVQGNKKREFFITREMATQVLENCPRHRMEAHLRSEPLRRAALPV